MSRDAAKAPKLQAGVIGAGWVAGARHIPALKRDGRVHIAAVYDKDPMRARDVADKFGISCRPPIWATCLPLDNFVSICTPPATHASLAIRALEAGRHVLVEKPMAMDVAEAESMIAAAESAGRVLCVSHNLLYYARCARPSSICKAPGPCSTSSPASSAVRCDACPRGTSRCPAASFSTNPRTCSTCCDAFSASFRSTTYVPAWRPVAVATPSSSWKRGCPTAAPVPT